jgi:thymidylate kinase
MFLHIEFVGLSGSGKSTCVRELKRIMNGKGIAANTLSKAEINSMMRVKTPTHLDRALNFMYRKLSDENLLRSDGNSNHIDSFLKFMVDNPGLFEFIFQNQIRRQYNEWERTHDTSYFFQLCSKFQLAKDELKDNEAVIIDEGFSYIPIRTLSHGNDVEDDDIAQYLSLVPRPHILFKIICDPVVCDNRMLERKSGHPSGFEIWDRDGRIKFLELSQRYIDFVSDTLSGMGVFVTEIDTSKDPSEIRDRMAEGITAYV